MINIKEIIKKYWLIMVVLGAVVIGVVALLIGGQNTKNQDQIPEPTPTEGPIIPSPTAPPAAQSGFGPNPSGSEEQTAIQNQELQQNQKDYPLANLLPYKTDLFAIDHYRAPRQLVVIIQKESDEVVATKEINKWLVSNGQAASSHQIIWTIGK
jgi:hypothetical protein